MKSALILGVLLIASTSHATVSGSVSCRVTRDDGETQTTSKINKDLSPNDEGGSAQADLYNDRQVEISAYSSDYRLDMGNRLFLKSNGLIIKAEADGTSKKAKLEFNRVGDATYTYDCRFVK